MSDKMRDEFEAAWAEAMRGDDPAPGRKPLRSQIEPERYRGDAANFAWRWWQRSREALVIELPVISDELLTAAYWDFDARRKGYPPYKVPAGHECSDFKVSITSTIVASVLGETVSVPKELV